MPTRHTDTPGALSARGRPDAPSSAWFTLLCVSPGWPVSWACLIALPGCSARVPPAPWLPAGAQRCNRRPGLPAAPPRTAGQICRARRLLIGRWHRALRLARALTGGPSARRPPLGRRPDPRLLLLPPSCAHGRRGLRAGARARLDGSGLGSDRPPFRWPFTQSARRQNAATRCPPFPHTRTRTRTVTMTRGHIRFPINHMGSGNMRDKRLGKERYIISG